MKGALLLLSGNIKEAEESCRSSLEMSDSSAYPGLWRHTLLARILLCQNLMDEAMGHCQKALEMSKSVVNPDDIKVLYRFLGRAYLRMDDLTKALEFFNICESWDGLESVYRALGKRDEFVKRCQEYRQQHADELDKSIPQQLYLEPAQISDEFSHIYFADDFNKGIINPTWKWIDEYEDCAHRVITPDGVEIHAANGRYLRIPNLSAPRLMSEISGDFAVQVCISQVTKEKPQIGGLLIWKDDKNYICFERGENDPYGFQFSGYINKERLIVGRGFLTEESEATYLRLERSGDEFSAYCSIDGGNWLTCGKITLPMEEPIQVGIHAIGMIDRMIYWGEYKEGTATLFRNFKIWTRDQKGVLCFSFPC